MNAPEYKIDVFEGPLDLLLHLIRKHKLNIEDVKISEIADQYLAFLEEAKKMDVEIACEFIAMAAHLLYLKSIVLLPKEQEQEDEIQDFKERLTEYNMIKEAALILNERQGISFSKFFKEPEKIVKGTPDNGNMEAELLYRAFAEIMERNLLRAEPTANSFKNVIDRPRVPLGETVRKTAKRIKVLGKIVFEELFDGLKTKDEFIVTFLAVLHLVSNGRVKITDKAGKIILSGNGEN